MLTHTRRLGITAVFTRLRESSENSDICDLIIAWRAKLSTTPTLGDPSADLGKHLHWTRQGTLETGKFCH